MIDVALVHGQPRVPVLLEELDEVTQLRALLDGHDVGPRDHHLAHGLVSDLDDAVDHLVLLLLDHPLLFGDVQDREQLFLGEVWGARPAPAGDASGDDRHRPEDRTQEGGDPVDWSGRGERHTLRVSDRKRLGRHLGRDQDDDRQKERHQQREPQPPRLRHSGTRQYRVRHQRRRRRGHDQGQRVREQNGGQESVRIGAQALQDRGGRAPLLGEEAHAQPAHRRERGLGAAGESGHDKAHEQRDQLDQLLAVHRERAIGRAR